MSSFALPIAIGVSILVYVTIIALLPKRLLSEHQQRINKVLANLQTQTASDFQDSQIERDDPLVAMYEHTMVKAFTLIPGAERLLPVLYKAGMAKSAGTFLLAMTILLLGLMVVMKPMGLAALPLSLITVMLLGTMYIRRCLRKQKAKAMELFPDALDMIVRSLKSGYPVNTAFNIVSENIPAPMNLEFKRILDEMSLGTPLATACTNFANRMDDHSVRFFAVVVSIQQESGGNLSHILGNISNVIRQQKHLQMRVHALSADGRMSAKVLIGLFVAMLSAIQMISPEHLTPMWHTQAGHHVLVFVGTMFLVGILWMRKVVTIEV